MKNLPKPGSVNEDLERILPMSLARYPGILSDIWVLWTLGAMPLQWALLVGVAWRSSHRGHQQFSKTSPMMFKRGEENGDTFAVHFQGSIQTVWRQPIDTKGGVVHVTILTFPTPHYQSQLVDCGLTDLEQMCKYQSNENPCLITKNIPL